MKPIIFAICLTLAGCANLRVQWVVSYASDNVLADIEREKRHAVQDHAAR